MLFMEGRQHISVTPMGGKMMLIYSPRRGELNAMVKAKEDWLNYYFKVVRPWSAEIFNDRRVVWVKVVGVPLHVWGENFFKLVGSRFGEFVDFDADTASRARLDVARIKISTPCRGLIESTVQVSALGCLYEVWVTEEKHQDLPWLRGRREEEDEYSYVESAAFPKRAVEMNVGSDCSSGEGDVEKVVPNRGTNGQLSGGERKRDKSNSSWHMIGDRGQKGGKQTEGVCDLFKETTSSYREVGGQVEAGVMVTIEECQQVLTKGALEVVGSREERDEREGGALISLNEEAAGDSKSLTLGVLGEEVDGDTGVLFQQVVDPIAIDLDRVETSEPGRVLDIFRADLELAGPGCPISIGGPCGVFIAESPCGAKTNGQKCVVFSSVSGSVEISLEGQQNASFPYIQKEKGKNKSRQPSLGVPKCIQLVEAVNNGRKGARKKKGRKGTARAGVSHESIDSGDRLVSKEASVGNNEVCTGEEEESTLVRQQEVGGSGVEALLREENSQNSEVQETGKIAENLLLKEASTLLGIQKAVGFTFEMEDNEVCDKMIADELRDRAQKVEREQVNGDQ
jgi:hypothetical protein